MKNIVLIGFMGCGKTSVGKRLAQELSLEFLDTDELIEQKQGRSIRDIFATDGEASFRRMETECLQELLKREGESFVLSVGGGLPVREENRMLMAQLGDVILLKVSPEVVYKRLKNDTTRPLLQGNNPRGRIVDLMNARKGFYEAAATHVIEVDEKNFAEIIGEIKRIYGKEER